MIVKLKTGAIIKKEGIQTEELFLRFDNPSLFDTLSALEKGVELEKEFESEEEQACFYYYLELLKKHGLLLFITPLLTLHPFDHTFSYHEIPPGAYSLSRFTLCRAKGGQFIIETPLSAVSGLIETLEGMHFVYAFRQPLTHANALDLFPHLPPSTVTETLALLVMAKILTADSESATAKQWDFHDLFFHSRSRLGRHVDPFGATYRFKGEIPSLPAFKTCETSNLYDLSKPEKLPMTLEEALCKRKSIRQHGKRAILEQELASFLYHSAHVKKIFSAGDEELSLRPYPCGGARYEFEIYPIVYHCEGIEQGVYHYHPFEHKLCSISSLSTSAEKLLADAQFSSRKEEYPQILIVIAARFQRVSWKYQSMAYALILKNLGTLLQTMYLVATAMDLAPCALGGGNSDLFCEVFKTPYLEETSVGEFMLGSR